MPDASHGSLPFPSGEDLLGVDIVGGGLGGLHAIHRLRSLGLEVRAYEAGSDIGGTWFWNGYPGARCDVESLEYSCSFSNELQQKWQWPERYGTQPEILRYINHVADRFDLQRDVQLDTRIVSALFDGEANRWTLRTEGGETIRARFCVMAAGNLSTPCVPDFEGLGRFKGTWYHSGLWPHEGIDFTGLRVGVIGTGSSGVQMIPIIARQATVRRSSLREPRPLRRGVAMRALTPVLLSVVQCDPSAPSCPLRPRALPGFDATMRALTPVPGLELAGTAQVSPLQVPGLQSLPPPTT